MYDLLRGMGLFVEMDGVGGLWVCLDCFGLINCVVYDVGVLLVGVYVVWFSFEDVFFVMINQPVIEVVV